MREMKNSGIEWIGDIPIKWRVGEIKYLCKSVYAGGTPQSGVAEYWDGDIPWLPSGCCHNCKVYEAPKRITEEGLKNSSTKMIPASTALLAMTGATCGNTALLTFEACANQSVTAYVSKENSDSTFIWYLLQAARDYILTFQTGGAQGGINVENCKNLVVPIMALDEQKRIADYLDSKCALIDSIIAKQEKIIEKLKEYKLSVITEAVTKGLDSGVEMKESGIEYIGKIPYGWHAERLKFLLNQIIDCPHETPDYSANGTHYVIRTADQDIASLRSDEKMFLLSDEEYFRRIRRGSLDKDDIVYGREGGRWGLASIVPESDKYCLGQRMLQFKCDPSKFIPEFAVLALSSETVYLQGTFDTMGSASPHVNISTVQNYWIVVPPLKEQKSIAQRIRKKISNIDYHIRETEFFLDKLVDYKKSLIYEVVTGKKEV